MSGNEVLRQNANIHRDSRGYIRQTDSLKNSRNNEIQSLRKRLTEEPKESSKEYTKKQNENSSDIFKNDEKKKTKRPYKLRGSTIMQEPRQLSDLDEWLKWNTTPQTEDAIREMCLTNFDFVCFTYICGYQQLSADFIEELMVLSTGLLTKDNYDQYYETVKKALLISMGIEEGEIDYSELPIKYTSDKRKMMGAESLLSERLDWGYVKSMQKDLPTWFKLKYNKQLYRQPTGKVEPPQV